MKKTDFHKSQSIGGTHCQIDGFALELVLTQKRKATRKLMGHFVSTTLQQQFISVFPFEYMRILPEKTSIAKIM